MKKVYLITGLLLVSLFAFSQQVSRNYVLVEIGTGCWCYYCPGAAMGADDLISNGEPAAIIENHNGDPFATSESNARNAYYGIGGYPTAWFDGSYDEVVGGSHTQSMYSTYKPIVDSRIAMDSDFTLDIFGINDGDDYTITLRIQDVGGYSGSNIKLRLALTESDIQYSWQGQTEVNFVDRDMIPDENGTDLSGYDLSQITDIELDFTFNNSWDDQNCELVAFLQDDDSQEVLQSQKVALNSLLPLLAADFTADDTVTCSGSTVNFTDTSRGTPTSWSWVFEGGTPSTSTDQNPSVMYDTPGVYDVQLTVDDGTMTDTKTVNDYITVLETPAQADEPSGDTAVCNASVYSYSTNEVPYTQEYEWVINPAAAGTLEVYDNVASLTPDENWSGSFSLKVRATNLCGDGDWSDSLTGTIYQSPELFDLEGDDNYCEGGDGVEMTLDGSETNTSYELYLDGDPTGIIVEGTGSGISFGYVTEEGYYTAIATNDDCSVEMYNQIHVVILLPPDAPSEPAGDTLACHGQSSDYATDGSDDADDYAWYLDPADAGTITASGMEATVDWNEDFGGTAYLTVAGINDCGEGSPSDALAVNVSNPSPGISGADEVCDNEDEDYQVENNDGSTYTWNVTGGNVTQGQGTNMVTIHWNDPGSGTITVEEETESGCTGTSEEFPVTIDNCTGIYENGRDAGFDIYPNPAGNLLNINFKGELSGEIMIYNHNGQIVIKQAVSGKDSEQINLSELSSGLYFVRIKSDDRVSGSLRFIKN